MRFEPASIANARSGRPIGFQTRLPNWDFNPRSHQSDGRRVRGASRFASKSGMSPLLRDFLECALERRVAAGAHVFERRQDPDLRLDAHAFDALPGGAEVVLDG